MTFEGVKALASVDVPKLDRPVIRTTHDFVLVELQTTNGMGMPGNKRGYEISISYAKKDTLQEYRCKVFVQAPVCRSQMRIVLSFAPDTIRLSSN